MNNDERLNVIITNLVSVIVDEKSINAEYEIRELLEDEIGMTEDEIDKYVSFDNL